MWGNECQSVRQLCSRARADCIRSAFSWVCVHPSTTAITKWLPSSILHPIALTLHCCSPLGCSALPRLLLFDLWPRLQVGAGGARCLVQSLTITIRGSLTPTVWQAWTMSSLLMADSLVSGNLSNMDFLIGGIGWGGFKESLLKQQLALKHYWLSLLMHALTLTLL